MVIHPDECIDCALCEPECPVEAIFAEDEVPEGQEMFARSQRRARRNLAEHHRAKRTPADAENGMVLKTSSNIWSDKRF